MSCEDAATSKGCGLNPSVPTRTRSILIDYQNLVRNHRSPPRGEVDLNKRAVSHRLIFRDLFDSSNSLSKESYTAPPMRLGGRHGLPASLLLHCAQCPLRIGSGQ
jgi:hypothetical protein